MVSEYGVLDRKVVYASPELSINSILYYVLKEPQNVELSNDLFERAGNTNMYVIRDED